MGMFMRPIARSCAGTEAMVANAVAISPVHRLMAEPMALVMEAETEETVAAAAAIEMQHALQ